MVSLVQFVGAAVGTTALAVLVHVGLGNYPKPAGPPAGDPAHRELVEVAGLYLFAMGTIGYAVLVFRGVLENVVLLTIDDWQLDLVLVLSALSYIVVPLALERGVRRRPLSELGVRLPTQWLPAMFLLAFGVGVGISAVDAGAAPRPPFALVAALYTPVLQEEILFRGVLQPKLERLVGVQWAWIASGVLFGLSHVPIDFFGQFWLAEGGGFLVATARLASQVGFGLLFGVVYAKTRSLLAPVVAHYCVNELGAVIETLLG